MDEQQPSAEEVSPPDLTSVVPQHETSAITPAPKTPWFKNKKVLAIIAVVVLLLGGGAAAFMLSSKPAPAPQKTVKKAVTTKPASATPVGEFYDSAKPLADLALFPTLGDECRSLNAGSDTSYCPKGSNAKYYEISTNADGSTLILITAPSEGPNVRQEDTYVATLSKSGAVTIYTQYPDQLDSSIDKTKVTVQKADYPAALSFPKDVTLNQQTVTRGWAETTAGFYMNGLSDYARGSTKALAPNKITTIDGKDFYDVNRDDESTFAIHEIFGAVKDYFAVNYQLRDELNPKDGNQPITWNDGTANTDSFSSHGPGCGSAYGFMVLKNANPGDMIKAGTSKNGTVIYQLPTTDTFFSKVYTEDYLASADFLDAKYKSLSKDQFQSHHGLVIAKNGLGQYQVYLNSMLIQGGGCAKPVVYLYPTKTSDVSVQVGALVTKSDPFYNQATGWQHVTAQPSGALIYQGKPYGSLFWEGLGLGNYPGITSGTVVPTSNAVATIRQQLAAQGLNSQESNDFLAYWQDKLPTTPFVRLSWLTTDELNRLAPLKITPAPQTVIRTFLDFQGLNLPVQMAPQSFHAPARNGFTVVEWGGLLR